MSLGTRDQTPPYEPIGPGGLDIAAGAEVELVAATPGRVLIELNHRSTAGDVWLGFGQAAQVGVGHWLEPGGFYAQFFAGAVRVRNAGDATVRVTWMEWGS